MFSFFLFICRREPRNSIPMNRMPIFLLLLLLILLSPPGHAQQDELHQGKASYYSGRFHGRRMSNGSPYHRDSLTCAHRSFPFGTLLEVTNTANNKSVIVEVTDRGPYSRSRIIDLSHEAARQLGMLQQGVTRVMIREHIPMPFQSILIPFDRNGLFLRVTEPTALRRALPHHYESNSSHHPSH